MSIPLQVHVLTENKHQLNKTYARIFTTNSGFAKPIFTEIQYPDKEWINRFGKCMSRSAMIELYNHYLIWMEAMNSGQPQVILYNHTYPTQVDIIIAELIKRSAIGCQDKDIVFYGKYLDLCSEYKYDRTIIVD